MSFQDPIVKLGYDEYCLFPDDGNQHEVINGLHFTNPAPNPSHQSISKHLQYLLYTEIELTGHGKVFDAPIDVQLGKHDIVQPDLIVILNDGRAGITETRVIGPPDLVVEILSRATARNDFTLKRRLYEQSKVREYWIVDPDARRIETYVLDQGRFQEGKSASAELTLAILPDVTLPIAGIFVDS